ncbi:hypothetical protein [Streptomyces sp. NPDC057910]|uniref:hypothetical protein n=1 Tax=Streptomyces sp. NPDC057910 TaxID=3346278 RepID=UPI0036EFE77C
MVNRRAAKPPNLTIGMTVYDRFYDMPATIDDIQGRLIFLRRPTGLTWMSRTVSVRPATLAEERQLKAIAKLHQQRIRATDQPAPQLAVRPHQPRG